MRRAGAERAPSVRLPSFGEYLGFGSDLGLCRTGFLVPLVFGAFFLLADARGELTTFALAAGRLAFLAFTAGEDGLFFGQLGVRDRELLQDFAEAPPVADQPEHRQQPLVLRQRRNLNRILAPRLSATTHRLT